MRIDPRLALLLLVPLALALAHGCRAGTADAAGPSSPAPEVRVRLDDEVSRITLAATAPPVLSGPMLPGPARLNLPGQPVALTLNTGGWLLGDQPFARGDLTLTPAEDGTLRVGGRAYRGRLRFVPRGDTTFDIVNDLDVESYLKGVLPKELPAHWSPETYEAQAVVARTYAIYELRTAGIGRGHFDLHDDDRSQVYGGLDAETNKSRTAVEATRGQVVVHPTPAGPRIFKAYFHSTSGGVTLGNDDAFNESPLPAFQSQSLGDLGKASKRFTWEPIVITKDEFTRRARLWGHRRGHPVAKMATLDRLDVAETNEHGRPTRFELADVKGRRFSLGPEEVRWAINTDRGTAPPAFSGFFRPINNADNVVLADGRGWGHGVGMCQWSAEALAKLGRGHAEIVTASYPGTRVVRAY